MVNKLLRSRPVLGWAHWRWAPAQRWAGALAVAALASACWVEATPSAPRLDRPAPPARPLLETHPSGSQLAQSPSPAVPSPAPSGPSLPASNQRPLLPMPADKIPAKLLLDFQIWGQEGFRRDQEVLLQAVSHSIRYLETPQAAQAYANYGLGFSRDRVMRSLRRFRDLVRWSRSAESLAASLRREFVFYQVVGNTGKGTAKFTGYFEPTYQASRTPTAAFRYPLYRLPKDLEQWPKPHPTRQDLEGADGLQGSKGRLKGLELVWLRDRLEAFLVQVQGSARLQMTDGSTLAVGYAGRTNYDYVSLGRELIKDGKVPEENLSLPIVLDYFRRNPAELNTYIPRNPRFVFFRETGGSPALGSLAVPVSPERSIATDKSLMPPGALALIYTQIPYAKPSGPVRGMGEARAAGLPHSPAQPSAAGSGGYDQRWVSRFVLDQDTGGAIRGPGRVDIFMGTGAAAGERAGLINSGGQLYYLLLKDGF